MKDSFFIDTNIFVYSFDPSNKKKQEKSIQIIDQALASGNGIISTQVVQEFLNVATQKFNVPMKIFQAEKYLNDILWPLCNFFPDINLYSDALVVKETLKISFYDALIVSSAILSGCKIIYSEDLQHDREYRGVKIVNPFIYI